MAGPDPFPPEFRRAADAAWGRNAAARLNGSLTSIAATSEESEVAALSYIRQTLGAVPFLNETSLQSIVFAAPGNVPGPTVDFVAADARGALVLVEAKPNIDSATFRRQPPDQKFGHTIAQLDRFYQKVRSAPRYSRLIVTATGEVGFNPESRWSTDGLAVLKHGEVLRVTTTGLPVEIVRI